MMTKQEIFDKVATHLLRQGKKSTLNDSTPLCLYRGPDGISCAVGCLIKDEHYNLNLEGKPVHIGVVVEALRKSGVTNTSRDTLPLLKDLQRVHDHRNPSKWMMELFMLAKRWHLSSDVIELGS
jgi:hypothetical protein